MQKFYHDNKGNIYDFCDQLVYKVPERHETNVPEGAYPVMASLSCMIFNKVLGDMIKAKREGLDPEENARITADEILKNIGRN